MEPSTLTLAEFARHIQRDPAWVARLRERDRLVMADDGRVRVAESIALIEATAGNRADVAERNAHGRAEKAAPDDSRRRARQDAELRLKKAQADRAEYERDELRGDLIRKDQVLAVMDHVVITVRERLLQLPQRAAHRLAGRAPAEAEQILDGECRQVLEDLGQASW